MEKIEILNRMYRNVSWNYANELQAPRDRQYKLVYCIDESIIIAMYERSNNAWYKTNGERVEVLFYAYLPGNPLEI